MASAHAANYEYDWAVNDSRWPWLNNRHHNVAIQMQIQMHQIQKADTDIVAYSDTDPMVRLSVPSCDAMR